MSVQTADVLASAKITAANEAAEKKAAGLERMAEVQVEGNKAIAETMAESALAVAKERSRALGVGADKQARKELMLELLKQGVPLVEAKGQVTAVFGAEAA